MDCFLDGPSGDCYLSLFGSSIDEIPQISLLPKGVFEDRINRELKSICEEALDINLWSPNDPQWKRQIVVPINAVDTRITLLPAPISLFSRVLLGTLHSDVPMKERENRYGYQRTREPEVAQEGVAFRTLKPRIRQATAVTTLTSPTVITTLTGSLAPSADILP